MSEETRKVTVPIDLLDLDGSSLDRAVMLQVYVAVAGNEHGETVGALLRRLGWSRARGRRALDRLASVGWLERVSVGGEVVCSLTVMMSTPASKLSSSSWISSSASLASCSRPIVST